LCFSSTDWGGIWGSRQQVMERFARRGHRVLYVEQLVGWEHLLRYPELRERKRQRWREGMRMIAENLWITSAPSLLPGRYYVAVINSINAWVVASWTRRAVRRLGFQSPILWLYKPEHSKLIGRFNERLCVYHCIDEWTAGTSGRKRQTIARLDAELVHKADVVFANSPPTYENKRRLNTNTWRIPSGVDVTLFAPATNPDFKEHPAIAQVPRPRIGYTGTINERLDYDILEHLARQRPGWSLVLIGDPYPWRMDAPPLRRLGALPNVFFLGKYPYSELPALLKGLDVCLIPYINDERGHYRSPLKLYEYLAAGKAVVSTEHPEVSEFREVVRIAQNPEDFVQQVEQAMAEDNPAAQDKRQRVARRHDWDRRVDQMEQIIAGAGSADT
jgi:glycosyltransferase involved in cell wall biosynthesis